MKLPSLSWWLLGYGAFVFSMGVLGYLSNPEKAATALKSGGLVAGLAVVWAMGWIFQRPWALFGAAATLGLVGVAFVWRSTVSWMAYLSGESQKLTAALLITAMLVATVVVLPKVLAGIRALRRTAAPASTQNSPTSPSGTSSARTATTSSPSSPSSASAASPPRPPTARA